MELEREERELKVEPAVMEMEEATPCHDHQDHNHHMPAAMVSLKYRDRSSKDFHRRHLLSSCLLLRLLLCT